jgi:hypothetical protein
MLVEDVQGGGRLADGDEFLCSLHGVSHVPLCSLWSLRAGAACGGLQARGVAHLEHIFRLSMRWRRHVGGDRASAGGAAVDNPLESSLRSELEIDARCPRVSDRRKLLRVTGEGDEILWVF